MRMFDWLGVLLLLISGCGPVADNPPPDESPAVVAQTYQDGTSVWADTAYTFTYVVNINNTGNVRLDSVAVIDSLVDADGLASDPVVTSGPTLINSHVALNGSWDGVAPNDTLFPSTGDSIPAGSSQGATFTVRFNHNGGNGPYTNYVWVRGTSPLDSAVTDTASVSLNPPPATENPAVGIAKFFGAVSGSSGAYSVPCTLIVENLGDVDLDSVLVVDTLTAFGAGTATMDSVRSVTSALLTANTAFDGTVTHDSLTVVNATDTLFYGQTDTITFVVHWDEGDSTSFDNQAWVFAQGPSSQDVQDKSDWGSNPDPNSNGNAGDANEGDVSTVSIPASGLALHDIVVSRASGTTSPWLGAITFTQGQYDTSVVTSGAGFCMADSNATQYDTDCEVALAWPDGSIRVMKTCFDPPRNGTYDVVALESAQTGTAVDISTDPGFTVTLNGATYTFDATDFTETSPSTNRVYREGYAEKDDATPDYLGQEGGLKVMWWRRWYADGSNRNFVGIRQQQVCPTHIRDASDFDLAIAADWSVNAIGDSTFTLRWGEEMNLGAGVDTTSLHLWHTGSYDYTLDSQYNYGGLLRPGEDLLVEIVENCDADAPVAFETAQHYADTKAIPYTDILVPYSSGIAITDADSLRSAFETTAIDWIEGVDSENPWRDYWKNVRDHGEQNREFDASIADGHNSGQDQYEMHLGMVKNCLAMSRVTSDTLAAHSGIQLTTWDLFEKGARNHEQAKYNIDYSSGTDQRFAYFNTWGHADHGGTGLGQQARGGNNQSPSANYMCGVGLWPLYYLTFAPHLVEKIEGAQGLLHYYANSAYGRDSGWPGEFRSGGNGMNWTSTIYDCTGDSEDLADLMTAVRQTFDTRDWGTPATPDPCGTQWWRQKPWQFVYAMHALRQSIAVLYRWGNTSEAQECESKLAVAQQFLWDNAWETYTISYQPGGGSNRDFDASYYIWGDVEDGVTYCEPRCKDCPDFWSVCTAGSMVDFPSDPNSGASFFETSLWAPGRGNDGIGGYFSDTVPNYQKMGIPMAWGMDYLYLRSAPGRSQAQQSIDTIWD